MTMVFGVINFVYVVCVVLLAGMVLFLAVDLWTERPVEPLHCPDGYAMVWNFGSKPYCQPGAVEPFRGTARP